MAVLQEDKTPLELSQKFGVYPLRPMLVTPMPNELGDLPRVVKVPANADMIDDGINMLWLRGALPGCLYPCTGGRAYDFMQFSVLEFTGLASVSKVQCSHIKRYTPVCFPDIQSGCCEVRLRTSSRSVYATPLP